LHPHIYIYVRTDLINVAFERYNKVDLCQLLNNRKAMNFHAYKFEKVWPIYRNM